MANEVGQVAAPEGKLTTVYLSRIKRDPKYQVRKKLNTRAVERLIGAYKAGRNVEPIVLAELEGQPNPLLLDGWHRVEALQSIGEQTTEALVIKTTEADARWRAASANLNHGEPLKQGELRKVFQAYVRARKHIKSRKSGQLKSYREIAPDIGRTYETIRKWMIKDFPKIAAKMGGNDAFVGTGGLAEMEAVEGQCVKAKAIRVALAGIVENFKSVADVEQRWVLIDLLESSVSELKASGSWQASDF